MWYWREAGLYLDQKWPGPDNAVSRCGTASAQGLVEWRSAEARRRAGSTVSRRACVGDRNWARLPDSRQFCNDLRRRERCKLSDTAPISQSLRDPLVRMLGRVIRRRYDAVVVVRGLLPVLLLVLVREAVANLNARRSDRDRQAGQCSKKRKP